MAAEKKYGQISWGWRVAAYLFLAGMGAGAYAVGVIFDLLGQEWTLAAKAGVLLGPPLVLIGTLFLVWDLGRPSAFWRVFAKPQSSWVARGSIIITVFMVLGAVHIAAWIWPFNLLEAAQSARLALGAVNLLFAFMTAIYTGLLLGASRPIPFWSTSILPFLFLVSALSTGAMGVLLSVSVYGSAADVFAGEQLALLAQTDIALLAVEFLAVFFYLYAAHGNTASRASARMVVTGPLAYLFWGGIVIGGLAVPLLVETVGVAYLAEAGLLTALVVAVPGLIGGLLLRYTVLAAGIKTPVNYSGATVFLPARR